MARPLGDDVLGLLPTGCFHPVVSSVGLDGCDTLCGHAEDRKKSPGRTEWTFRHLSLSSSWEAWLMGQQICVDIKVKTVAHVQALSNIKTAIARGGHGICRARTSLPASGFWTRFQKGHHR